MSDSNPLTVAIHQPNILPWVGYFYKMLRCDVFVLLDDVQFSWPSFTGRVKIKNREGVDWFSIPMQKKGRSHKLINEVMLAVESVPLIKSKPLCILQNSYAKAPYFNEYFPAMEAILQKNHQKLAHLNEDLLQWMANVFNIKTKMIKSSELENITGVATERLISICKELKAHEYLSGFGGQNYQDVETFNAHGIEVKVYDFKHPVYPQLFGEFTPGLSAVDLLFNCGPQSGDIIKNMAQPQRPSQ